MAEIIVESSYGSIWRDLMEGITWFAGERRAGWQVHCVTTDELPRAIRSRPAGVICVLRDAQGELIRRLLEARVPAVNLLREVHPRIGCVMSDNRLIGARAAEHLQGQGFAHFRFVGVERAYSAEREEGFCGRLRELGRAAQVCPVKPEVEEIRAVRRAVVERRLAAWLRTLPRPVAVCACADFVARMVLECCRQAKLAVPQEVAVVGVDNDLAICELATPPLSSVPQNLRRIGFEAARLLEGMMARRRRPRAPVLVPPLEMVVRRSSDFVAMEDPRLAAALRQLRSGDPRRMSVAAVVREAGVSRQWLDRQFRARLGATPSELIRQRRLAAARVMLLETHLPVET
ncbi:MAG TPA: substrate-binding domain-containing protein, partial [Phycisphaerae bacterium]|nr:substrate-binding domain-containing protein [Phycisphaerae bacterium]